ncbi:MULTISPECIES: 2OG-Fe(II) oxygenase [Bacillaceae]|uniref:2OG-Fe(II) oxygenase n=1 Tax=Bacillaceae TaxID=186817 RepID=UPI000BFCCC2E|nr:MULTISPECIES: 2OG-Fe(II) oxygenase [Bacillaceae]PGT90163.1 hypothetical protein COD11_03185 [Bacillus sp. AFS040349]UGB32238.1 2OG-Fe(II) oxygenase [Metabacillus sp. B2-18]
MKIEGTIISGEFDFSMNEFSIHTVKRFHTESTLKERQISMLYEYLTKHKDDDGGQFVTLYDQLPVHLTGKEMNDLIEDLRKVKSLYE